MIGDILKIDKKQVRKMRLRMEHKSRRYENIPRPRRRHKYTKKMCLGIVMVTCIKQHLRNI